MFQKIIAFSLHNKPLVGLMVLALILAGIWSFSRLPIDAVPDITNNQVQILTGFPLGYYMGAQGSLIVFLGLITAYAWRAARLDRRLTPALRLPERATLFAERALRLRRAQAEALAQQRLPALGAALDHLRHAVKDLAAVVGRARGPARPDRAGTRLLRPVRFRQSRPPRRS